MRAITRPIRAGYNRLRPYIPRQVGTRQGVLYRGPRVIDARAEPDWKQPLVDAIHGATDHGHRTVHIGGGWGVAPVISAEYGPVTVFEAADAFAPRCRETAALNGVADLIDVRHAVVGEPGEVWGPIGHAEVVPPSELPEADVYVIDCEGAETAILDDFGPRPNALIVECGGGPHNDLWTVRKKVLALGYDDGDVVDQGRQFVIHGRKTAPRPTRVEAPEVADAA